MDNDEYSSKSKVDPTERGLPDGRYFTADLAEASKKPFFFKSVSEAGILKINELE